MKEFLIQHVGYVVRTIPTATAAQDVVPEMENQYYIYGTHREREFINHSPFLPQDIVPEVGEQHDICGPHSGPYNKFTL